MECEKCNVKNKMWQTQYEKNPNNNVAFIICCWYNKCNITYLMLHDKFERFFIGVLFMHNLYRI